MELELQGLEENFYRKFSPEEFKRRHALLRGVMREKGLDVTIVYGGYKEMYQQNGRWLTGMREAMHFYGVFPLDGEPTAYNSLYPHLICAQRISAIPDTRWGGPSMSLTVAERVKELGLAGGRIGLVGVHSDRGITLPMDHYLIFREEMPKAELVNITREVEDLQLVKSEEELSFFAKGAAYTDYTMAELIKAVKPGVSEVDLYGRIMIAAHECGGSPDFALLGSTSMAEPDMPYPWHIPSERVVQTGDIVLNEISVSYGACSGQLIVPIAVGEPPAEYRELHAVARHTLDEVAKVLRPGATQDDIAEAATPITDAGFIAQAPIIHGWPNPPMRPVLSVGIRADSYGKAVPFTLQENMLIMVEPNPATLDRKKGLFVGAMHVVTKEGGYNLHKHPLDFAVV
jgi:Xaa-Pro aminopeptidase